MNRIIKIYYQNIYGVIATLGIHLILVAILLTSELRPLVDIPEETVYVDFSTELIPVPEKTFVEQQQNQAASAEKGFAQGQQRASNIMANDASKEGTFSRDPSFNREYDAEIKAAQELVSNVNKTLSQKIPKIGNIAMPEESTSGMTSEQIKQSNFKGNSNIRCNVENRFPVRWPIPTYLARGGGEVTVDIIVAREGRVISASPRLNPMVKDMTIYAYAKQAAEKTEFNSDPSATEKQRGTISYTFIPQ